MYLHIQAEAKCKSACKYTALFCKCNNEFCRKATSDHSGPDHLCLDPVKASAAVREVEEPKRKQEGVSGPCGCSRYNEDPHSKIQRPRSESLVWNFARKAESFYFYIRLRGCLFLLFSSTLVVRIQKTSKNPLRAFSVMPKKK